MLKRVYSVKPNGHVQQNVYPVVRKCHQCQEVYPLNQKHFKLRADGNGWLRECLTCYGHRRTMQRAKAKREQKTY